MMMAMGPYRVERVSSLLSLLLACGSPKDATSTDDTGTGEPAPGSASSSMSGASTSGASTSSSSGSSGGASTTEVEQATTSGTIGDDCQGLDCYPGCGDPGGEVCEVWLQNCPEGQKCAPFGECDGFGWSGERCVPLPPLPKEIGEVCEIFSKPHGIDDCDLGSFCWGRDEADHGICVALCGGTPDAPSCVDPSLSCIVDSGDSTLGWCLPPCNPLANDCPASAPRCDYQFQADYFVCWPAAPGFDGKVHEPCNFPEACAIGLVCVASDVAAVECDLEEPGCCQPHCDLAAPEPDAPCSGVGQQCVPVFPDEPPFPELADVGVCLLPP